MYKVVIKCDGKIDEIMETEQMRSKDVYECILADFKDRAHREKLTRNVADRYAQYDAYVYKNGKILYLISLRTRFFIDSEWIGITRGVDLKTCVIRA